MKTSNFFGKVIRIGSVFCLLAMATNLYAQEKESGKDTTKTNQSESKKDGAKTGEDAKDDDPRYESDWYDEPETKESEEKDTVPLPNSTISLMLGALPLENSLLVLVKGGYEVSHFGAYLEVSRDDLLNTREDKSQDHYFRWSYSALGRAYSGKPGRDLFAELALTYSYLSLWVTEANGETFVDRGNVFTTGLGAGYRLVRKPKGIFGEIGARGNMYLTEQHLYTELVPPSNSKDDNVTDRSWYFEPGKFYFLFYAAIGVTF